MGIYHTPNLFLPIRVSGLPRTSLSTSRTGLRAGIGIAVTGRLRSGCESGRRRITAALSLQIQCELRWT